METDQTGCTLRAVAPGIARNHNTITRSFSCRKTADHGRGEGFTSPPRPSHLHHSYSVPLNIIQGRSGSTRLHLKPPLRFIHTCFAYANVGYAYFAGILSEQAGQSPG